MNEEFLRWLGILIEQDVAPNNIFSIAMTHGSTGKADYQRLEFLGDRVLAINIAEHLYHLYPEEDEGRLAHRLNALVSGKSCAKIARHIELGQWINLGKQARDDGARNSDNILGDVMESLIGAVYLTYGHEKAKALIIKLWDNIIEETEVPPKHPKSAVQEWCASNKYKSPIYNLVNREGPPHMAQFTVELTINGFDPIIATASSKQLAETSAAEIFLRKNQTKKIVGKK
ncbi:ribonuclease III [Sphingorhabdus lutea]|uniref:ribonuclease III n=1 Tax=Sphingorhabdus lutea TaxID=1913578 RepID=UPI000A88451D|nr:ribonuclease III [Sphingorhabdus lutea]